MPDTERKIVTAMLVTVLFALIGEYVKQGQAAAAKPDPFKILLGGGAATAVLVGMAELGGNAGSKFGLGLATVAMVSAVLVEGGPVWSALNTKLSSKTTPAATGPTAPTGNTGTTAPTQPISAVPAAA